MASEGLSFVVSAFVEHTAPRGCDSFCKVRVIF
jgi:hypothetical protein